MRPEVPTDRGRRVILPVRSRLRRSSPASSAGRSTRSTSSSSSSSCPASRRISAGRIPDIALAITVTLAFRPVGAFIFGLMADRYGRRLPLMIDLVFFSIVEVLSGLAPNYTTFLVLRALFGIGMGGEWGVGASLAMEKAPPRWRGVLSGLLQEGYATRLPARRLCYFFVFPRWGWRADVLHRRPAGAARALRPLQGEGVRGLGEDAGTTTGRSSAAASSPTGGCSCTWRC